MFSRPNRAATLYRLHFLRTDFTSLCLLGFCPDVTESQEVVDAPQLNGDAEHVNGDVVAIPEVAAADHVTNATGDDGFHVDERQETQRTSRTEETIEHADGSEEVKTI